MVRQPEDSVGDSRAQEIASALHLLHAILGTEQDHLKLDERPTDRMVYTHALTLWMLILQRLGGGHTLEEVVAQVLSHDRQLLPENKRVRENTLSENTGAYARARKRLPLEVVFQFSQHVCEYLGQRSAPLIDGRRVFVLDGTTIALPPTKALQDAFPPASNQHGQTVWPVVLLGVAHELQSGCAWLPQIDPMYGENNASEAAQAQRIVRQLPPKSIVMADSGYGIFRVAYHTVAVGHDILFRLSHGRFKALRRQAELIDQEPTHKTYRLIWKPSNKDLLNNPDLPLDASIEVALHEVQIKPDFTLYLVSTLELDGPTVAEVYHRRYDVEFDIRDLKVTLDTENIRAKSVDMFKKELYTSIVAYNLVAQIRRQAAKLAGVKPRRLRFKGVWTTVKNRLLLQPACSLEEWLARYEDVLCRAANKKHPNRPQPRVYPRKAHPKRQKTTKFEKAQRKKNSKSDDDEPPPPELK